jgi:DnaJ-class molecular chaperone
MPEQNHYQVLQVDPSAGQDIITAAYKQLAKTFHPDVNKSRKPIEPCRG